MRAQCPLRRHLVENKEAALGFSSGVTQRAARTTSKLVQGLDNAFLATVY